VFGAGAALNVVAGGHVVGDGYHGYAGTSATGTGSTIAPTNYSTVTSATQLCATGSVAATSDYGGSAQLGINLNQAATGTNPPANSYVPTGSGVTVNVSNAGGATLRVMIQAPGGDTDATKRWCAGLTTFDSPVTIPWSSFNTACWDNSGTFYSPGTALDSVIIIVPGGNATAVSFDFCLNALSI
jgi:hypothetical protein